MNLVFHIKRMFNDYLGIDVKKHSPAHWEPSQVAYLIEEYKVTMLIDAGANTGQYAKKLRDVGYKGKIVSFEPIKVCYDKLKETFKNDTNIECHHTALGNFDGESILNISNNEQSSSILQPIAVLPIYEELIKTVRTETIQVKKLDSVFLNPPAGTVYLKIDVQGFELELLKGAKNTLQYISIIQIESSLSSLYADGALLDEVISYLRTYGFTPYNFIKGVINNTTGQLYELDMFFVKSKN